MPDFKLNVAMSTHVGVVRENNEDAVGCHYPADYEILASKGALFVLADGVGGLPGGEEASRYTVDRLIELYYSSAAEMDVEEALVAALEQINSEVFHDFKQNLATTVLALVIRGDEVTTVYAGDSPAYRYNGERVEQYTRDHVVTVLDQNKRRKTRLTRAIGNLDSIQLDVLSHRIDSGHALVMLSDGASTYFSTGDLMELMKQSPREIVFEIIRRSILGGGHDNISAIVISPGEATDNAETLSSHVQQLTMEGISIEAEDNPEIAKLLQSNQNIRRRLLALIFFLLIIMLVTLWALVNDLNSMDATGNAIRPALTEIDRTEAVSP